MQPTNFTLTSQEKAHKTPRLPLKVLIPTGWTAFFGACAVHVFMVVEILKALDGVKTLALGTAVATICFTALQQLALAYLLDEAEASQQHNKDAERRATIQSLSSPNNP